MKDLELKNDKDVIIAKQNAYIKYLEYEISQTSLKNGKLISEIEHLEYQLKEFKKTVKQIEPIRHLELKLKEKNILINELKKELSNLQL